MRCKVSSPMDEPLWRNLLYMTCQAFWMALPPAALVLCYFGTDKRNKSLAWMPNPAKGAAFQSQNQRSCSLFLKASLVEESMS